VSGSKGLKKRRLDERLPYCAMTREEEAAWINPGGGTIMEKVKKTPKIKGEGDQNATQEKGKIAERVRI